MTSTATRQSDQQWDITTGVGVTALAVAAARHFESARPDALVRDPYAGAFVAAAGTILPAHDNPAADEAWQAAGTYIGMRSRYFDDALTAAVASGITQVVLLAAGLDTRAHRLDWASSTTVFELDVPAILAFKDRVLDEQGARTAVRRVPVAADLREDWPESLLAAGLDPARPTVWLAEGLLCYLPSEAERLLFERVQALSAPGSRFCAEDLRPFVAAIDDDPELLALFTRMLGSDLRGLFQGPTDARAAGWFATHDWSVRPEGMGVLVAGHRRRFEGRIADSFGAVQLFCAARGRW